MSARFQYVNMAGVILLAGLCVFQWQRDRALNLEVNRLERARITNEQLIADQAKDLRGLNADLALFKEQIVSARAELADTRDRLRTNEVANAQLTAQRDQLRESITNWMNAVTVRDERLKRANDSIGDLADRLNASILKFNDLATNYNAVVQDLNALREASRTNSAAISRTR